MSEIVVREFRSDDSFVHLTELLHAAYFPLTIQGIHFFASTQTEEHTRERVKRAHTTFIGLKDKEMIATISLYKAVPDHRCEHYRTAWYFGQFAVRPDLQRAGIGSELIRSVEKRALADGATHLALDTAETAFELIHFYQKRGFEFVQYQKWPDVPHRSMVFSKRLVGNEN